MTVAVSAVMREWVYSALTRPQCHHASSQRQPGSWNARQNGEDPSLVRIHIPTQPDERALAAAGVRDRTAEHNSLRPLCPTPGGRGPTNPTPTFGAWLFGVRNR